LIVIALLFAAFQLFKVQLGETLYSRVFEAALKRNTIAQLDDGLHVALCGTGSPLPDPTRKGPCTVVIAGKQQFLIDSGSGSGRNLGPMGITAGNLDAAFLTHFHSDHIDGLGQIIMQHWAGSGSETPLPVYGPTGISQVIEGINKAYDLDEKYRIAHHGADMMPAAGNGAVPKMFEFAEGQTSAVVYEKDGVKVTAFAVNHEPIDPAVGYRFDYKGRSVVLSGDTSKSSNLITNAKGADLLVHEVLNKEIVTNMQGLAEKAGRKRTAKIFFDIRNYHTSPVEAAETAKEAGVHTLVFSHIVPAVPTRTLYPYYLKGTEDAFDGDIIMGEDGMLFSLPAGSKETVQSALM